MRVCHCITVSLWALAACHLVAVPNVAEALASRDATAATTRTAHDAASTSDDAYLPDCPADRMTVPTMNTPSHAGVGMNTAHEATDGSINHESHDTHRGQQPTQAPTPPPGPDPYNMNLTLLDPTGHGDDPDAVCLDGSPGGFYFRPALDPAHANDWVLHFKGAGWCYDENDCYGRATIQAGGQFGSSTKWANVSNGWSSGILSPNCEANPDFCNFNKIILLYCDGASFTGDRSSPIVVQGMPLYFRGRRIMDAILNRLLTDPQFGMNNAKNVLLTGCSSGGLSAYLHANHVQDVITAGAPKLSKFRVAPESGFFLQHNNLNGTPVYPDQIKNIFDMSNSSVGVNDACIAATPDPSDHYKCMFAQNVIAYIKAPLIILNSALDMWQTGCIFTADLPPGFPNQSSTGANGNCNAFPDYKNCSNNPEGCTSSQMTTMNTYLSDFVTAFQSSPAYDKAGNGVFAHSCHTHCEALAAGWHFKINNVTMQEATSKWWAADASAPASTHRYLPCYYHTTSPHECNPSCGGD
eukprot:m.178978 g.178978  ORF g.178978 m.178978 type:complete len:525 (-) comp14661_c0_seq1:74-1648(-)